MRVSAPTLLVGVALLVSLSACSKPKAPPKPAGDGGFTLVYTQAGMGQIEPCSCNNRTTGGFPRRQGVLNGLRQRNANLLIVDAGNSLFSEEQKYARPDLAALAKEKAKAIAAAFVKTGLDAYTFGELDLRAGGRFFLDVVKETGLPVVAANVFDRATGKPVFQQYKIVDFGGLKVAVLGLVAQELHPTVSQQNAEGSTQVSTNQQVKLSLEDLFEDKGVKIDDPVKIAQDLIPEIRREAHLVVVLSHLAEKPSRDLPKQVPGIDFVVGSHKPASRPSYQIDGSTLLLSGPMNGTSVSVCEFRMRGGNLLFADYTAIEKERDLVPVLKEWRADTQAQYGTDDEEKLAAIDPDVGRRFGNWGRRLAEYEAEVAAADPAKTSHFIHYGLQLDGVQFKDDPELLDFVKKYRGSLKALYPADDTTRNPAIDAKEGARKYIGSAQCAVCHREQAEFWAGTKHGHAWQTMVDQGVTFDLECIVCHTVGYMQPGGFDRPDRVAGYENVQCEACHDMGSQHFDNILDTNAVIDDAGRMDCERCHSNEHSPNFRRDTYVPRASCPPIDPFDPMIRGSYGKLRTKLEEIVERKQQEVKPHVYAELVDLYLRLGRNEEALKLADEALVAQPRLKRALSIGKARALDATNRTAEGIELLTSLYQESESDEKVNLALIDLLLNGKDPDARDVESAAALVEYGIGAFPKTSAFRVLAADVQHARGDTAGAIRTLKELMIELKMKSTTFLTRIDAWQNELLAAQQSQSPPPLAAPPQ